MWGKLTAIILSLHVSVEGEPPKPPFFVVSNHLSYIDVPIYSSILNTTFVSKAEVKHWPVIGIMARTLGILFVNRSLKRDVTRVNREISQQLNERQGVVLFPEGMTSPGKEVLKFKPALLEPAASEGIEVSYAAIRYETGPGDSPAYKSVCWWGTAPLHIHLYELAKNKRIDVLLRFGDKKITNINRKNLARMLHKNVEELFIPVINDLQDDFEPIKF